ncbi:hypothetical protein MBLNU13_g10534t2 [Cladosporium sp. NU13]
MPKPTVAKSVWFLPRTRDRPVISAIRLGDIVESPWSPEEALNDEPPPAINPGLLRRQIEESWSWTKETELSRSGGVFATFLQLLGIGGDVEGTRTNTNVDLYEVDRMVTEEFLPDKQYLRQCIEDAGVRDTFVGPSRKSKVYMVTGLKIAYGAIKAAEMMKECGVRAKIGVDASALGVPVAMGPQGHWSSCVTESLTADKSDFVFAFKLRRLKFKKGELWGQAFDRGAQYGLTQEPNESDSDEEELDVEDFDIEGLEDAMTEEFMMQSKQIVPSTASEEEIRVFFP